MNDKLKQRLVGAGVLLILAGLLWPLLFDFDEQTAIDAPRSEIPAMPVIEKVVVAQPKPPQRSDAEPKPAAKPTPSSSAKVTAAKDKESEKLATLLKDIPKPAAIAGKTSNKITDAKRPRLDKQGVPVSFVVQVGTFSNWSNADSLRNKLVKGANKAYIKPSVSVMPGPYTVFVGPVLTYEKAEVIVANVKRQARINDAIIKRFRNTQ